MPTENAQKLLYYNLNQVLSSVFNIATESQVGKEVMWKVRKKE